MTNSSLPTFDDVTKAALRLEEAAHRTPIITSRLLNGATGAQIFLKPENLQRTGSFKFRGAYNAIASLSEDERSRGVITYSSGNHAQGISLAASLLGAPATVVMPADAPLPKREATAAYGGRVVLYDRFTQTREAVAGAIQAESGATLIPPFNHRDVIAGQGTAALELIEDAGFLDALYVCVGGGGLIGGSALAAKALSPRCKVIGVEPAAGDDATRSFQTKQLQRVDNPDTIADGARTTCLGSLTFPMLLSNVDDMMTVTDEELLLAMVYAWERLKLFVEPTGALALAGLLKTASRWQGQRVGVIISGGNADVRELAPLLQALPRR